MEREGGASYSRGVVVKTLSGGWAGLTTRSGQSSTASACSSVSSVALYPGSQKMHMSRWWCQRVATLPVAPVELRAHQDSSSPSTSARYPYVLARPWTRAGPRSYRHYVLARPWTRARPRSYRHCVLARPWTRARPRSYRHCVLARPWTRARPRSATPPNTPFTGAPSKYTPHVDCS